MEGEIKLMQEEPRKEIKWEERAISESEEFYVYIQVEGGGDFPCTSTMPLSVIMLTGCKRKSKCVRHRF